VAVEFPVAKTAVQKISLSNGAQARAELAEACSEELERATRKICGGKCLFSVTAEAQRMRNTWRWNSWVDFCGNARNYRRLLCASYQLIDITDRNRSPKFSGQWWCEMDFLRQGSSLMKGVMSYE